jgi:lipopolysaccharide/colanic/teichoic acid biosynthesis glycosyltransferase
MNNLGHFSLSVSNRTIDRTEETRLTRFAHRLARTMDPILQFGNTVPVPDSVAPNSVKIGYAPPARIPSRNVDRKRLLDIALSTIALIILSPLMLLTTCLIKLTSRGPIFFRQERVGLNRRGRSRRAGQRIVGSDRRDRDRRVLINFGTPFTIYKFRTMIVDAETGRPVWAQKQDPRITRLGRFLRRTRIDELPQFINVLRGEMSIVGPRPERAYFIGRIEKDLPEFQLRLKAKPGITGLAQVELGYTNTNEGLRKKLNHDLEYIRNLNVRTDLKILFKTVYVVLSGKGAC